MITRLAHWLARKLAGKTKRDDVDYIRYGIEVTLGITSKFLFFVFISYLFGLMAEMLVIVITFALFRTISGGVHLSTYLRCFTSSTILFFLPAFLLHNIAKDITLLYLIIAVFITTLLITLLYVPVAAANRPIPEEKHLRFKWTSITFLIIWLVGIILIDLYDLELHTISFFSAIGILLQSFTLTPFGIKFFHNIDRYFEKRKNITEVKVYEKST